MNAYDEKCLNDLAGRIEAVGRVVLHLVATLEDAGTINGPKLADGLRHSVVPKDETDDLLNSAKRTLDRVSNSLDEAREWRRLRRQFDRRAKEARCTLRLVK